MIIFLGTSWVKCELTGQEADDGLEHSDNSVDNGHDHTGNGVDDRHDAGTNGLETGDDGTHVCSVLIGNVGLSGYIGLMLV